MAFVAGLGLTGTLQRVLHGSDHHGREFVSSRWSTLEKIIPALACAPPAILDPPLAGDVIGTAMLAVAIEAATSPMTQKVVTKEEKWPHSYGQLLLLTGVILVGLLHDFWHEYANQKKAQLGPL
jgi:hypothetical protein